jgi:hypothetical protein
MSPETQVAQSAGSRYKGLLHRVMAFLAVLVVARFVLEIAGVPEAATRYVSSTAGLFLAAIYLAAMAPMRGGMRKFRQLLLPSLLISAWTAGWVILATIVTAVFRIERSHFAEKSDYGNWGHLGHHLLGHVLEIGVFFVLVLIMMTIVHVAWRWPVTVAPVAVLGVLVIMRYWVEAMGGAPTAAAAWSSTIGVLLSAVYIGGFGPRQGFATAPRLLVPSLVVAFAWRAWIFLAVLLSALIPFYKTHFFDPTGGRVVARLARFLAGGVIVEGLIVGLIVWGIAVWIARATRPAENTTA